MVLVKTSNCMRKFYSLQGLFITAELFTATKLGQGNIFRSVCQEFCPQGGGGMHGRGACMAGGCAWQEGMHAMHASPPPADNTRYSDTVNEQAVRILLECILVSNVFDVRNFPFRTRALFMISVKVRLN